MAKVSGLHPRDQGGHRRPRHGGQTAGDAGNPGDAGRSDPRGAAAIEEANAELAAARDELQRDQSAHDMAHLSYTRILDVSKTRARAGSPAGGGRGRTRAIWWRRRRFRRPSRGSPRASSACAWRRPKQARYKTMYQYARDHGAVCRAW